MEFLVTGGFVVLVLLILNWIRLRRERFSIFKRHGIPGPEPNFWTGNFKEITEKREDCVSEYVKKYGNVVGFFIGTKPFVIVTDEELIKTIQVKEFNKFQDRDPILRDAGIPQGEIVLSMPASRGAEWRKKRQLVTPSFSTHRLRKLMPILNNTTETFMQVLEKRSRKEFVDVLEIMRNVSLDIMVKTALGIDSQVQHMARSMIVDSARLFLMPDTTDILPALSLLFPEFEPIPTVLRNIKDNLRYYFGLPSAKFVFKSVHTVMDNRRKNSERREDVLQGLMEQHVELENPEEHEDDNKEKEKDLYSGPIEHIALSDASIVGTASILVVAGFSTNSITLSYVTHYLAKHQDVQEKVREEINVHVGKKDDITYEEVLKLQYLDQVLAETLRLHSTGMLTVNRIAAEPFYYNGMTIPKDVTIIIPSNYLHRNPRNWPDAEKFDPDRFSPEDRSKVTPFNYQPFGHGPRNCVGMRFAQLAIKMILVRLVRSYYIQKYSDKEPEIDFAMFIPQPKGILVKMKRISD